MSRRVPSCDLDDNPASLKFTASAYSNSSIPSLDYEVAELTWENGQLAMHGLGPSRVGNKLPPATTAAAASPATWDKPRAGGTLESIVNQATGHPHPKSAVHSGKNELAPWFDQRHALVNNSASAAMTMDALVPCSKNIRTNDNQDNSSHVLESVPGMGTCMVGSCSAAPRGGRSARAGTCCCRTNASVSESATFGGRDSRQVTIDSCEREFGGGAFTSTTLWLSENTSSDKEYTRTSEEDHDSVCHSRPQREAGDRCKNKRNGISAKSRAAAIHNQSERKRRDKINQRMKTLQKLVPNSSKTDKASMLDEVIEYLKQLQAQVHMMSRMNMPTMMLPLHMQQQQLQMSMMGMGMGMGMGVMDINNMGRAAAGMPPMIPAAAATASAAAFMPMASWDMQAGDRLHMQPLMPDLMSAFMACQSQPMTIDAHSRLAALYQQSQRPHAGSGSKN